MSRSVEAEVSSKRVAEASVFNPPGEILHTKLLA